MKKSALFALVMLVTSSIVIGKVLLGQPDPLAGWNYAVIVASFGFTISLHYLLVECTSYWIDIWPYVYPIAAGIGIVFGASSFVVSLVHFFAPELGIFPNEIYNLLMVAGIVLVLASILLYCREWPRAD